MGSLTSGGEGNHLGRVLFIPALGTGCTGSIPPVEHSSFHLDPVVLGSRTDGLQDMCLHSGQDELPVQPTLAAASHSSRSQEGQQQDQHGAGEGSGVPRALIQHMQRNEGQLGKIPAGFCVCQSCAFGWLRLDAQGLPLPQV